MDFRKRSPATAERTRRLTRGVSLVILGGGMLLILLDLARQQAGWRRGHPLTSAGMALEQASSREGQQAATHSPYQVEAAMRPGRATGLFPGIRVDLLHQVEDDMPFRPAEAEAWFHLFAVLSADKGQASPARDGQEVSYAALAEQPGEYRGRLVAVHGTVRRAVRMQAPPNTLGINDYFQLWMFPGSQPVVVYCLRLPPGFPLGEQVAEQVGVTGIFFKRLAYGAVEGPRTAPVLAALEPHWIRTTPVSNEPVPPWAIAVGCIAGITAAALAAAFAMRGGKRRASTPAAAEGAVEFLMDLAAHDRGKSIPPTEPASPPGQHPGGGLDASNASAPQGKTSAPPSGMGSQ